MPFCSVDNIASFPFSVCRIKSRKLRSAIESPPQPKTSPHTIHDQHTIASMPDVKTWKFNKV